MWFLFEINIIIRLIVIEIEYYKLIEMNRSLWIILWVALSIAESRCYNILGFFSAPSPSHHIIDDVLMRELAERGHNVNIIYN